jgi:pantoate--beta-alanine ligase
MTLAFESVAEARAWLYEQRACGLRIGFVPTMGALHEGHLDLVRRAARENDLAIVSVFVNPLQFNDPKDYAAYPRTFAEDVRLLSTAGCAMAFTGTLAQFFPHELDAAGKLNAAHQVPPGAAALGLEGAMRPGHFEGVAAIVDRLFETVLPDTAYFGAKDYQQAQVVLGLARRRGGPRVVVCPTVREASGLALSSRNARLSVEDRQRAAQIYQALRAGQAAWNAGVRDADALRSSVLAVLQRTPEFRIEYVAVRDPSQWTAEEPHGAMQQAVCLVALWLSGVRLIDNLRWDAPA